MKVLAFADVRTSLKLPDVEPDVVLLLGDIPSLMVSRINRAYNCTKLGVMGNHCHPSNFDDTNIINMHNKVKEINGITFAGFEGSPYYKDRPFGQHTEEEAKTFIRKIGSEHINILMTHSNPAYGDMDLDHAHRGFMAFNELLFNNQMDYHFHGHLHDPFVRNVADCEIHSVYPYSWLPNLSIKINRRR
jgi:hypothetical protein